MSGVARLSEFLSEGYLLLDFDGPICSIFARYSAPTIARELVTSIDNRGVDIPLAVRMSDDPLQVLRWAREVDIKDLVRDVEEALCVAELEAARTAKPTEYAREVIVSAAQAGLKIAVVSNNSTEAIAAYLGDHRLTRHIAHINGRAYAQPALMKPNPTPILTTVNALSAQPWQCVLVGDSLSDITACQKAGVPVIGYANKARKSHTFREAGANFIVTSMKDLADALMEDDE